jgi:hypothetical protein
MTAEVLTHRNDRKFIPIYRHGETWEEASPTWLRGKYRIDLRGDPYREEQYQDLLTTLHGLRPSAPPVGTRLPTRAGDSEIPRAATPREEPGTQPIKIIGIVVDEVTTPRLDGTSGSALYRIPFQLSRRPSHEWATRFPPHWNHPSRWTTMHRPGIATVADDKIYLDGTTMEEVERYHRDTLKLAIHETNQEIAQLEEQQRNAEDRARKQREEHKQAVRDAANRIEFD